MLQHERHAATARQIDSVLVEVVAVTECGIRLQDGMDKSIEPEPPRAPRLPLGRLRAPRELA